ncbi:unnamed protein product, partial [Pelagomonas calceolata]
NRKLYLYIDRETSFLTMYSLLGSLNNHGRRMTRSACGSSRHSAGAAGSRRQSFLKRRTLFLYASPTTVSGAFTPSSRRVVARATLAIVLWRCAWPDARRRAASMASASSGASGGGCVEARAPIHMSFVVNGASGAARRATKFVRSANAAAGVAWDSSVSVTRAVARRFGRCMLLRAHTLCIGPFFLQFLPAIGSSDSLGLVTASVLFAITFALSKQGQSVDD